MSGCHQRRTARDGMEVVKRLPAFGWLVVERAVEWNSWSVVTPYYQESFVKHYRLNGDPRKTTAPVLFEYKNFP